MGVDETATKVVEILRANPDGLSRAGLLAWARLRVAPDLGEEQLDEALQRLGGSVSTEGGFVRLLAPAPLDGSGRQDASASVSASPPPGSTAAPGQASANAPAAVGPSTSAAPPSSSGGTFSTVALLGEAERPPPGPDASRIVRRIAPVIAIALFAGIALASRLGGTATTSASPLPSDPRGSMTPADGLAIGMCFAVPGGATFSDVEVLPCDVPHDGEVVSVFDDPAPAGATFRTDAQWDSAIGPRCDHDVDAYVGGRGTLSISVTYGWFVPDEQGWSQGARTIQCYLTPSDSGTLSRSLRSGR